MTETRTLWELFEPYHALTYFSPEAIDAYEAIGLRGFWRGYFAGRAAPLGPVGPGVVTATFYGFHPSFVARALPSIWELATPADALDARLDGMDRTLHRLLPDRLGNAVITETADLLRRAVLSCESGGRPLFSANLDLPWPDQPHLALWQAATLAREHRGDGHVAALIAHEVGPCESHILRLAVEGTALDSIRPYRGWTDDDWAAGVERLQVRGLLDSKGGPTTAGQVLHDQIEHATDAAALELGAHLTADKERKLIDGLRVIAGDIVGSGVIPYPNPIGVPRPRT